MARARACTRPRSRSSRFDASMKIDVLSIGAFPEATNAELANRFAVTHHFPRPTPDALGAELKSRIRAIATEANRGADRALIAALPKLEVIAIFGVGTDSVDLAAARERNVMVTNTPGILTDEVADLAIGLMLASARQILFADRYVREGTWASKGPIPLGRSVGGKTMGVLGLGGIGRAIADRAAAPWQRHRRDPHRHRAAHDRQSQRTLRRAATAHAGAVAAARTGRTEAHYSKIANRPFGIPSVIRGVAAPICPAARSRPFAVGRPFDVPNRSRSWTSKLGHDRRLSSPLRSRLRLPCRSR